LYETGSNKNISLVSLLEATSACNNYEGLMNELEFHTIWLLWKVPAILEVLF